MAKIYETDLYAALHAILSAKSATKVAEALANKVPPPANDLLCASTYESLAGLDEATLEEWARLTVSAYDARQQAAWHATMACRAQEAIDRMLAHPVSYWAERDAQIVDIQEEMDLEDEGELKDWLYARERAGRWGE